MTHALAAEGVEHAGILAQVEQHDLYREQTASSCRNPTIEAVGMGASVAASARLRAQGFEAAPPSSHAAGTNRWAHRQAGGSDRGGATSDSEGRV